jgi:hypothetical protein
MANKINRLTTKESKEKKLLSKIVASGLSLIVGGVFVPKISANPPAVLQDTEKSSKLKWVGGAAIVVALIGGGALLSSNGNGVKTETPGDIDTVGTEEINLWHIDINSMETIENLEHYIIMRNNQKNQGKSVPRLQFFETLHHFTNALYARARYDDNAS